MKKPTKAQARYTMTGGIPLSVTLFTLGLFALAVLLPKKVAP